MPPLTFLRIADGSAAVTELHPKHRHSGKHGWCHQSAPMPRYVPPTVWAPKAHGEVINRLVCDSILYGERDEQAHSALLTMSQRCKTRVPGQTIEPFIMSSQIAYCGSCRQHCDAELALIRDHKLARRKAKGKVKATWDGESESGSNEEDEWGGAEPGIMKPDITFFGQALDSQFDECLFRDREEVDLLVIIGTSLKVAPVSEVLSRPSVPNPSYFLTQCSTYTALGPADFHQPHAGLPRSP